ncbi:hypothetical protein EDD15DRAFT_2191571 [Pisolithus albus]|nr:hypothetical protein EDD15DRAFT_2191571 [Pisolithus albus]
MDSVDMLLLVLLVDLPLAALLEVPLAMLPEIMRACLSESRTRRVLPNVVLLALCVVLAMAYRRRRAGTLSGKCKCQKKMLIVQIWSLKFEEMVDEDLGGFT